jgi:hypothetical protein
MCYQMPNDKMITRCPACREQFQYAQEDKQVVDITLPDRTYSCVMIVCPLCGQNVCLPF